MRDGRLSFQNRHDAGQQLVPLLEHLRGEDMVVLGLPRGGVPVASEVARALRAPLDVIVVRKLGVPWQTELAMGAIGEGDVQVLNDDVIEHLGITEEQIRRVESVEREELHRRVQAFRGQAPRADLSGKVALIVDDGIATGSTAEAACGVARAQGARRIVIAAPVASAAAVENLRRYADEIVCVGTPRHFGAIGVFYRDFSPTRESEVRELLDSASTGSGRPLPVDQVSVTGDGLELAGRLSVPPDARSIVIFAHGSGSSMMSPRNRRVAAWLNAAGHGTLLFDLLTEDESRDRHNVFDIPLLAGRLIMATAWVTSQPSGRGLPVGYFGASTGAAAALWAAAELGRAIGAVVSRGGRPDLAGSRLGEVESPTLLVVGGRDAEILELNRLAARALHCAHEVAVIPGAGHLFEELGTLDEVSRLAEDWFDRHLG